ncbi:hypothetical protein MZM54_00325 [[Brevibacterium] frigoritolerans]|nr:hypothetical protein [Peribacillus frigoritolerans]
MQQDVVANQKEQVIALLKDIKQEYELFNQEMNRKQAEAEKYDKSHTEKVSDAIDLAREKYKQMLWDNEPEPPQLKKKTIFNFIGVDAYNANVESKYDQEKEKFEQKKVEILEYIKEKYGAYVNIPNDNYRDWRMKLPKKKEEYYYAWKQAFDEMIESMSNKCNGIIPKGLLVLDVITYMLECLQYRGHSVSEALLMGEQFQRQRQSESEYWQEQQAENLPDPGKIESYDERTMRETKSSLKKLEFYDERQKREKEEEVVERERKRVEMEQKKREREELETKAKRARIDGSPREIVRKLDDLLDRSLDEREWEDNEHNYHEDKENMKF